MKRFAPIVLLTVACWAVFVVNLVVCDNHLTQYGIIPRHPGSLPGILWSPFLHGSYQHLVANTLPLLILGAILCARSPGEFTVVAVGGILLGGGLTWLFARSGSHIGASGLIFCLFGYLASLAYFNRTFGSLLLSVVCLLAYGGMLRGVVPTSAPISWEGHAAGLVAGVVMAWFVAKVRKTPMGPGPSSRGKLT